MNQAAWSRISNLRDNFNFNPDIIYDIGAHEGAWTKECKSVFPQAAYIQFEADTDKMPYLPNGLSFFEVLGNKDDKLVEYYKIKTQFTTGNSIFKENSYHYTGDNFYTEKRKMVTLDTIIAVNNLPLPNFIKIDTQGSELLILEGAKNAMENAEIILLEVNLHEYNKQSPLILEVLQFMDNRGFILIDIIDMHNIYKVLAQIDVVFAKKGSRFCVQSF